MEMCLPVEVCCSIFMEQRKKGLITITNKKMTRFNISLDESVKFVLFAIDSSIGGEIYVPKFPSYKITDLAKAIAPDVPIKIVGIRPGKSYTGNDYDSR